MKLPLLLLLSGALVSLTACVEMDAETTSSETRTEEAWTDATRDDEREDDVDCEEAFVECLEAGYDEDACEERYEACVEDEEREE